jgi:hypothetical protein
MNSCWIPLTLVRIELNNVLFLIHVTPNDAALRKDD